MHGLESFQGKITPSARANEREKERDLDDMERTAEEGGTWCPKRRGEMNNDKSYLPPSSWISGEGGGKGRGRVITREDSPEDVPVELLVPEKVRVILFPHTL